MSTTPHLSESLNVSEMFVAIQRSGDRPVSGAPSHCSRDDRAFNAAVVKFCYSTSLLLLSVPNIIA